MCGGGGARLILTFSNFPSTFFLFLSTEKEWGDDSSLTDHYNFSLIFFSLHNPDFLEGYKTGENFKEKITIFYFMLFLSVV
jgi:hypothetical protein